ncbi:MAG: hypothetical protein LBP59_03050 [Planctomycetaceae bacterium]|nr:hypothetical protein [Planctomycetaceae bacterium]
MKSFKRIVLEILVTTAGLSNRFYAFVLPKLKTILDKQLTTHQPQLNRI